MEHGAQVRIAMTKWGDRPHWEFDATYLGADDHGDWIGIRAGTPMARPGAAFVTETDQVGLVPRADAPAGGWWVATFHAPGYHVATYVDMTTAVTWNGTTATCVDLDLDVIRLADGIVYVDDEDEFAEHQVAYGYPPETIAGAEASCAWVHDVVLNEAAPFDGASSQRWFERTPWSGSDGAPPATA